MSTVVANEAPRQPPLARRIRETYGVNDVAALFGVKNGTVRAWARSGRLPPPARVGKRVIRWRCEDIDKLFEK